MDQKSNPSKPNKPIDTGTGQTGETADTTESRTESQARRKRADSFGPVAETYARVRPGYPKEAIAWILPEGASRVLDVGAGTGALSGTLVALGFDVVAVEPDPQMRRVLEQRVPAADVRAGRAEDLPVDTGEVDAVLGAQMWHWVEPEHATSEVARVLPPGGTLGLLWNLRDERVPWMAALGALVGGADASGSTEGRTMLPKDSPFNGGAVRHFPWSQELSPTDLVDLMATRSQVQVLDEPDQQVVLDKVGDLVRTHPGLAGRSVVQVPYVTSCFRAVRQAEDEVTAR